MEIIYRANDGTEFTDEEDCYDYEHKYLYESPLPLFIDKCFNAISSKEDIDKVQYILCRNKQEYYNMIALFDYLEINAPDDEWIEGDGYCLWSLGCLDWCEGDWINVTKQLQALQDICDRAIDCLQDK